MISSRVRLVRSAPAGLALALTLALISSCSSSSTSGFVYRHELAPDADFSSYARYGWVEAEKNVTAPRGVSPALEALIVSVVDSAMESKGYQASKIAPDIVLNFMLKTVEKTNHNTYTETWSTTSSNRTFNWSTYTFGTFLFDAFDAESDSVVWAGDLQGMLEPNATEDFVTRRVYEAIAELLKDFPQAGD